MAKGFSPKTRKARTNTTAFPAKAPTASAAVSSDLEDEVRGRAYELYEQDGRQDGRDQEYWLRAEAEVFQRHGLRRA